MRSPIVVLRKLGFDARIQQQTAALRAAIEQAARPTIIRFPGNHVTQRVQGDGNIVAGGDVAITNVDMRRAWKRSRSPVLPGTVATDPHKIGYLKYLAERFNEFKRWETGKTAVKYALIHVAYRRAMKYSIANTPLDHFAEAVTFLQQRIRNTMLGRIKAKDGNRLFEIFEEFVSQNRTVAERPV